MFFLLLQHKTANMRKTTTKNQQVKPPHLWWHCRGISKQPHKSQPRGALRAVSKAFLGEAGMQMIPLVALYIHGGWKFWLQRMTFTSRNDRKDCKVQEHTKWPRAWSGHEFCHWSKLVSTDFPVKTPVISVPLTGCQPSVSVGGCVLYIAKASGMHCYHENTNGFLNLGILVPLLV